MRSKDSEIIVVTAGQTFNDIDVLACAIAYSELLKLQGKKSEVVLPGPLNNSVTKTIRKWKLEYLTKPSSSSFNTVLVDISEPEHFAKFVRVESIIEIYDHHFGFEDIWQKKLGDNSHIEPVGACATLIWEEYKKKDFSNKISNLSANLLYTAILSNTLDFGAQITDKRDILAFKELEKYTDLPKNWSGLYFSEVEKSIFVDIKTAVINDTKTINIPKIDFKIIIGQLEIWNAADFLNKYRGEVKSALESFKENNWFMNLISISEKKNYIYTESQEMKKILGQVLTINFNGNIGVTDKLWLRKEIIKEFYKI